MTIRGNGSAKRKVKLIYESPDNSPGFLLWQVNNRWQRKQYWALREVGLTHVQFVLLAGIAWLTSHGKKVSQANLSNFVKADKMMTSQVVRKLIEKNFVTRVNNPQDSRSYQLKLTDESFKLTQIAFKKVESIDEGFFESLSKEESEKFTKILEKLSNK